MEAGGRQGEGNAGIGRAITCSVLCRGPSSGQSRGYAPPSLEETVWYESSHFIACSSVPDHRARQPETHHHEVVQRILVLLVRLLPVSYAQRVSASVVSRAQWSSYSSRTPTHHIVLLDILVNRLLDECDCFLSSAPALRDKRHASEQDGRSRQYDPERAVSITHIQEV
jgi:hypothetical protein